MDQKKTIRVLLVDDSSDDRELILMNLRRGGYDPDYLSVDTKKEFIEALDSQTWDVILCDYSMPDFDGISALNILNGRDQDIPFILVSGAIGEELAVKVMKSGAHDYLMKDNLHRLIPVIEREISEAENRREYRAAQRERDRLLTVIQNSLNEVYIFDSTDLSFRYLNRAAQENLGYSDSEISSLTPYDINPQIDNRKQFDRLIQPLLSGKLEKELYVTKHTRKDGSTYPIEMHLQLIEQGSETFFTAIGFDLTDREKDARRIKEQKKIARELALHSQYKSEFLANMSHELRTPLNSIILLSQLLGKDPHQNLNEKQLKYVNVIHKSGNSLLELINEVLDLSKIESGEMELSLEDVELHDMIDNIRSMFDPIAAEKNLTFSVELDDDLPSRLITDQMRVEQVIKNLLSNAFKFTATGSVTLRVFSEKDTHNTSTTTPITGFQIIDTGIGIPEKKQSLIFQSFRQVDGSTQRRYGGTGLGLSICKQITELLGGSISVQSTEGKGSTFTIRIPADSTGKIRADHARSAGNGTTANKDSQKAEHEPAYTAQSGGQANNAPLPLNQHVVLAVTSRTSVQEELATLTGRGDIRLIEIRDGSQVLEKAIEHEASLIVADPLTDTFSGWTVAKQLSTHPITADIPVWLLKDPDHPVQELHPPFFNDYMNLPLNQEKIARMLSGSPAKRPKREKTLLLVDDNEMHNTALQEFAADVVDRCVTAQSAKEAFQVLRSEPVDCIVLDLSLPDISGAKLLDKLSAPENFPDIPVIIYSGKSLTSAEKENLKMHAADVIFKNVGSHSKLIKKVSSLLEKSPEQLQAPLAKTHSLTGKKVLIADDDPASYFSLSSLLELEQMHTVQATSGKETLHMISTDPSIDIVLMDVMMPDMDGFDVLQSIRTQKNQRQIPLISVTAKAMKGDRETCLQMGATDYISKPVDPEKLLALLNIWIGTSV